MFFKYTTDSNYSVFVVCPARCSLLAVAGIWLTCRELRERRHTPDQGREAETAVNEDPELANDQVNKKMWRKNKQ